MRVKEILDWLDENGIEYKFKGDDSVEIWGFSSINEYKEGTLTWIKNEKLLGDNNTNLISCAVVESNIGVDLKNSIITDNSKMLFFSILHRFWGENKMVSGIGQGSVVSDQVVIGDMVNIGCNCTIMGDISIGAGTVVEHNVVIQGYVRIGVNCVIHSGTVIGTDGFGYFFDDDVVKKVEHFGGVIIGDDVEIGGNTCIDRGTIDCTLIESNTKIDNLVHVAHNVKIGKGVCVVAGSIICGSAKLEDGVYVAPGAIVKNQVSIGKKALVGMGGVVLDDVNEEMVVVGVPAVAKRRMRYGDK